MPYTSIRDGLHYLALPYCETFHKGETIIYNRSYTPIWKRMDDGKAEPFRKLDTSHADYHQRREALVAEANDTGHQYEEKRFFYPGDRFAARYNPETWGYLVRVLGTFVSGGDMSVFRTYRAGDEDEKFLDYASGKNLL